MRIASKPTNSMEVRESRRGAYVVRWCGKQSGAHQHQSWHQWRDAMRKTLELSIAVVILACCFCSADTLILRDGSRHSGTFVSATSRVISFKERHNCSSLRSFKSPVNRVRWRCDVACSSRGNTGIDLEKPGFGRTSRWIGDCCTYQRKYRF